MERWVPFVLGNLVVAGCIGGGTDDLPADDASLVGPVDGLDSKPPVNTSALPTLGPAVDPWAAGETQRILFEGTVDTARCEFAGTVPFASYEDRFGNELIVGCAWYELPVGTLIPEGTSVLRIEADATQALKSGGYLAYLYTANRDDYEKADGEPTTETVHTWRFELKPGDWDASSWKSSGAELGFYPHGNGVNVLDGTIKTKVVAERDPNWTPLAPIDRFQTEGKAKPQPGVVTLLDWSVAWEQSAGPRRMVNARWPDVPPLARTVPFGTTTLVAAASWAETTGCPPTLTCEGLIDLYSAGSYWDGYVRAPADKGDRYAIWTYGVPDEAGADSIYSNQTTTAVAFGFFTNPGHYQQCYDYLTQVCWPPTDVTTKVHLIVEAWKDEADLAAVKARLGMV